MVIPVRVDEHGNFLSYNLTQSHTSSRTKRNISQGKVFYKIFAFGKEYHFELERNKYLLSYNYDAEILGSSKTRLNHSINCHYVGYSRQPHISSAAISNCFGLHGIFQTNSEDFLVEPLWNKTHSNDLGQGHPHVVYRRSSLRLPEDNVHCGNEDKVPKHYQHYFGDNYMSGYRESTWGDINSGWRSGGRRRRSAISEEKHVETLVVADTEMVRYHGKPVLEAYILSIMNVVAKLFHDASIGNAINIVVSRLVILEKSQDNLTLTHHADRSLDSFCKWQHIQNLTAEDNGVNHHDNAILLTGYDICTYKNKPCGTLGLAPVGGMCDRDRSCSINEDIGLASAFTIAHEIGHNFGMQHDGSGNICGTPGSDEPAGIMAAQLTRDARPFNWSSCSRRYITDFIDNEKSSCLNNVPSTPLSTRSPGRIYPDQDVHEQCKLQFGAQSYNCKPEVICRELWCINKKGKCRTNSIPAAEGTDCHLPATGNSGWCYLGECRPPEYIPEPVDGQWGVWSQWSTCTRTCGGGVESGYRRCDGPKPRHGGKYCVGLRIRYRSCNIKTCPDNDLDFRELQCADFNTKPFRGKLYNWRPFTGAHDKPCALNCIADGFNFYTERARKVIDGTRCYPDKMDMCIDGKCLHVGCDGILGSSAAEDICRVCNGDNSTCNIISGQFDKILAKGSYREVVRIPKGAMNIIVEEMTASDNYLALKNDKSKFYINGGWTIDWPRKFSLAGTVLHYERKMGEPEIFKAQGPINEDLVVMLLMQVENRGVNYRYVIPKDPMSQSHDVSMFTWQHSSWSACSQSCGKGKKISTAVCTQKSDKRIVNDHLCSPQPRPGIHEQACNVDPCPPSWSIGDWSACSATCGGGRKMRTILCVQVISSSERVILPEDECPSTKPTSAEHCRQDDCPPAWFAENWSTCSVSCEDGIQSRKIYCMTSDRNKYLEESKCDNSTKPASRQRCKERACPGPKWKAGKWRACSAKCGAGRQVRSVSCRDFTGRRTTGCDWSQRPTSVRDCNSPCESKHTPEIECYDRDTAQFCPLVVKHQVCNREYFFRMCCRSCITNGQIHRRHRYSTRIRSRV
ncbi:hypothetical protein FSP39_005227 [Pinctada imbricata]|uniref:A disintegrin and metalloproteinase with thrombospondin motifs 6 n=1 Tax=Pinctada imbricata TaxID=66713 RepID=A0AA88XQ71_PINIB|nr:hypothetical protein FSP39_005227 [Pinctada imbricata]